MCLLGSGIPVGIRAAGSTTPSWLSSRCSSTGRELERRPDECRRPCSARSGGARRPRSRCSPGAGPSVVPNQHVVRLPAVVVAWCVSSARSCGSLQQRPALVLPEALDVARPVEVEVERGGASHRVGPNDGMRDVGQRPRAVRRPTAGAGTRRGCCTAWTARRPTRSAQSDASARRLRACRGTTCAPARWAAPERAAPWPTPVGDVGVVRVEELEQSRPAASPPRRTSPSWARSSSVSTNPASMICLAVAVAQQLAVASAPTGSLTRPDHGDHTAMLLVTQGTRHAKAHHAVLPQQRSEPGRHGGDHRIGSRLEALDDRRREGVGCGRHRYRRARWRRDLRRGHLCRMAPRW